MLLALAFTALAVFSYGLLAYRRWTHHGEVMHCQVSGKVHAPGGEKSSATWWLDLRVDETFPGSEEGMYRTQVDRKLWKRLEPGDFVEAQYRTYSIGGRGFQNVTVGGGAKTEEWVGALMFTVAAVAAWYFWAT